MTYKFDEQLKVGAAGEATLDAHFGAWFDIVPASDAEQRQGIDRWFTRKTDDGRGMAGQRLAVEYKTDTKAAETHNLFIETVSVGGKKLGWAHTTRADWLVLYIPGEELAYIVQPRFLRLVLIAWARKYPTVTAHNEGYDTRGILVPQEAVERIALEVVNL